MENKKEIGILTFHNACNYGAFLQAKALLEVLNSYSGVQAFIIDYRNSKVTSDYSLSGIFQSPNNPKTVFLKLLRVKDIIKRNKIFSKFQENTFHYIPFDDKERISGFYKVVVGSDQVWGRHITGNDNQYFLPFVEPEKRISYAASAGRIDDNFEKTDFKSLLSGFSYFSVRENELYLKLSELGFADRMTVCVDPVFLKKKEQWEDYADSALTISKPYILVFIMGVSKQADYIVNRAIKLAEKNKHKVILLGDQERWYKYRNVVHFGVATPKEFVALIHNAECVLANSFHATAFSIILHTPFYTEMNIKNSGRLISLLRMTGLENREMYDGKMEPGNEEDINWNSVDDRLKVEIQKSFQFIEEHIIL